MKKSGKLKLHLGKKTFMREKKHIFPLVQITKVQLKFLTLCPRNSNLTSVDFSK